MKLQLAGAQRYNLDGELFVALKPDGRTPIIYLVDEEKGEYLMDQTDPQTGFPYFDEYKGEEAGVKPGALEADDKAPRRERPRENERRRRPETAARRTGPRNNEAALQQAKKHGQAFGQPNAPIEDADKTTV